MSLKLGIFERRFPNQVGDLGRVTEETVRFLEEHGAGNQAVYAVHLSIEELVTNIIKYGYDDGLDHRILIDASLRGGDLVLRIVDDGHEFDPLAAPPPDFEVPMEERSVGGLGIHLLKKLARSVAYQRADGKNVLTVCIELEPRS